jgi:tRNA(fMet)-specific endonuclease VapC
MYMLDTNICIYIIKKKPIEIIDKFRSFKASEIGISSITLAELEYGVSKSQYVEQNKEALAMFVSPLEILDFDSAGSSAYGEIRAELEKSGKIIGSMDMLIAAHARSLNATLVTNNVKEFKRVSHLRVENWITTF